jgi:hypothetical protein
MQEEDAPGNPWRFGVHLPLRNKGQRDMKRAGYLAIYAAAGVFLAVSYGLGDWHFWVSAVAFLLLLEWHDKSLDRK